jgi:L-aminopeptidase/D-esterase-like protein
MFEGCITDVAGITAAHETDAKGKTGCTLILARDGAVGSVDVRGGAPGTRETDAFSPLGLVERVHAVMLCGGSAFGLCAADGAMSALEGLGIGFDAGVAKVPIVGAAVLFDLAFGDAFARPTAQMGSQLVFRADTAPLLQGSVGAGTGATISKHFGLENVQKGGFGCASMRAGKATVAAAFAVNAVGSVFDYRSGQPIAAGFPAQAGPATSPLPGTNTTIGVVATDAVLTRVQAKRMAMIAHDGLAMAIRPVHTMHDGDTAFALATMRVTETPDLIFAYTAEVVARAIYNAIMHAKQGTE